MLIQVATLFGKYQQEWRRMWFKEVEEKENPFVFNNMKLWEKATIFLQAYIDNEVEKIVKGKRLLLFTNRGDLLFARVDVDTEEVLRGLITYLQEVWGESVSDVDCAFFACKLYNEVEEQIVREAIDQVFVKESSMKNIRRYLFKKKMEMLLEVGKEVVFTELEERYAAYDYKTVWQYHYEG